jgi:hypothetical protein
MTLKEAVPRPQARSSYGFGVNPSQSKDHHQPPSDTSDRAPSDIRGKTIPRDDPTNEPDPYLERMRALFTTKELECLYESTRLTTPRHYSLAAAFGDEKKL